MQEYKELIAILVVTGLVFTFAGYGVGRATIPTEPEVESHSPVSYQMSDHDHGEELVEEDAPVPSVELTVSEDSKDGFNFVVVTENFEFTPENIGKDPVANEGHAHLYINNQKVMRIYSPNFHIPSNMLKDGENDVTITLNANNHADWVVTEGEHIRASVLVEKN